MQEGERRNSGVEDGSRVQVVATPWVMLDPTDIPTITDSSNEGQIREAVSQVLNSLESYRRERIGVTQRPADVPMAIGHSNFGISNNSCLLSL